MHVRIQGSIWSGKPRHANLTDGKSRAPPYNGSAQIALPLGRRQWLPKAHPWPRSVQVKCRLSFIISRLFSLTLLFWYYCFLYGLLGGVHQRTAMADLQNLRKERDLPLYTASGRYLIYGVIKLNTKSHSFTKRFEIENTWPKII